MAGHTSLTSEGVNVHMIVNLQDKGRIISVYESLSNQGDVSSSDNLEFPLRILMFPIVIHSISQKWIWIVHNGSEVRVSLVIGNEKIEEFVYNKVKHRGDNINAAPIVMSALTAVVTNVSADPMPDVFPLRLHQSNGVETNLSISVQLSRACTNFT
jgi:hypothetical protein